MIAVQCSMCGDGKTLLYHTLYSQVEKNEEPSAKKYFEDPKFSSLQALFITATNWWFRNPKQPPLGWCQNPSQIMWYSNIYHINWWSPDSFHQQYQLYSHWAPALPFRHIGGKNHPPQDRPPSPGVGVPPRSPTTYFRHPQKNAQKMKNVAASNKK